MKKMFFIILTMIALTACSGEDPVYWYDAGASDGAAAGSVPYYPEKPQEDGDQDEIIDGYTPEGYSLVWSDEFNSQTDLYSKWTFEKGGTGWGNNELQYYCANGLYETTGQQTASVSDGTLKIKAYKIAPSSKSDNREYISTRMNTKDSWMYGYIEMRARVPMTRGCWPAFWMLPSDGPYDVRHETGWGGEIDIMEYVPNDGINTLYFSAHCYNVTRVAGRDTAYIDPETGERYSYCQTTEHLTPNNWHCYGLEWTADYIRGYLDGVEYFYAPNPKDGQAPYSWPFDQKFYLKLNLAIGGSWGGTVDPHFQEETFEVDWVRVYQK